jgi:hypothetical protein
MALPGIRFLLPPALVCGLALLVLANLTFSLAVLLQSGEVMHGEAVIHDQAARLLHGEPLYQSTSRPPYTIAAYTPVYYWLVAGLQAMFGPGFAPGRIVSLLAAFTTVGLLAALTSRRADSARAGAFAACVFLALGLPGMAPWSVLYKEDMLGAMFSFASLAALDRASRPRQVAVAGAFAALAFLTKQTLIAPALAGALWLWPRDRSRAVLFAGTTLALSLGICAALELTTGAFVENTVLSNVNPFRLDVLSLNLGALLVYQAGPLIVAGSALLARLRARQPLDLVAWFWVASLLPRVGLAKVGSNYNYWIELAGATAVLATLASWPLLSGRGGPRMPAGPAMSIAANVMIVLLVIGPTTPIALRALRSDPARAEAFRALVERVRTEPSDVLAGPLDVVTLAGRPNLLEPYIFSILYREGRWDPTPIVDRICSGGVGMVVLNHPLESESPAINAYSYWPEPVYAAFRSTMSLQAELAGRFVYVRNSQHPASSCASAAPSPTPGSPDQTVASGNERLANSADATSLSTRSGHLEAEREW